MIAQAATYARCLFAARESRHFVLVIAFNHKTSDTRFCFFRRDGLWASDALNLRQAEGFKTFVHAVAGILSWGTLFEAGMDEFRSDRHFFIASQFFEIVDVFCNRRCVRGSATRVYKIKKSLRPTKPETEQEVSGDNSIASRDDAPTSPEQPTHRYNLRTRDQTQPVAARGYLLSDLPAPPHQRPALRFGSCTFLAARLASMTVGGSHERAPRLATGDSDSDKLPPALQGLALHPDSSINSPPEGQIPEWYIKPRTEDWEKSRLEIISPFAISGPPFGGSEVPASLGIRYWKLKKDQFDELHMQSSKNPGSRRAISMRLQCSTQSTAPLESLVCFAPNPRHP
jgi:hypothetical protein